MADITIKQVAKRFGKTDALHSIDLNISDQEFMVLLGASGCGKTTLLRIVAGLETATKGEVWIGDKRVDHLPPRHRGIAMVFQNYALYPHLNVADNIAFGLRIRKESKDHIKTTVAEVAEILGLTDYLERRPADLSGGQRQRVAMGRAIVRRPKVFLFDEPLSNLDAKLRTQMRAEIKQLHKRLGATSIYVTHDQIEAMTLADRIVVMNDGNIEQIGTPMELFLNPANAFVAGFLGSPPMNQIRATVASGNNGLVAKIGDQQLPLASLPSLNNSDGCEIIVGVRPEFAEIASTHTPNQIKIKLDLVETLGSEALLHATLADNPIVLRTGTLGGTGNLQDVTGFTIKPELIKLFDAKTGAALSGQEQLA